MTYILTDEQFEDLLDYFEKSTTAISNEEIGDLLDRDLPLLAMLREIAEEQG